MAMPAQTWTGPAFIIPTASGADALLGAMRCFAILAYPEERQDSERKALVFTATAWLTKRLVLKRRAERAAIRSPLKADFSPAFTAVRWKDIAGKFGDAQIRIRCRLMATEIAIGLLDSQTSAPSTIRPFPNDAGYGFERTLLGLFSALGQPLPPLATTRRDARSDSKTVLDDSWLDGQARLDWRESVPVLHLALAIRSVWADIFAAHPGWQSDQRLIDAMISNPDWVTHVVALAEEWRIMLPHMLGMTGASMVPLRAVASIEECENRRSNYRAEQRAVINR
jgi:hypothetical protein